MSTSGIRKLYYSISEIAEATGLKPHVLRYWETEFPQLQPKKNRAGNRAYTERDLEIVRTINHLLRDRKFTIEGARQELESRQDQDPSASTDDLRELRDFLTEMLTRLDKA
jgi:DNA-binding transcriptional MerR regulator